MYVEKSLHFDEIKYFANECEGRGANHRTYTNKWLKPRGESLEKILVRFQKNQKKSRKIKKNQKKKKIKENQEKSKNQGKSRKIKKNQEKSKKSRKIKENQEKSEKIKKNQEKSKKSGTFFLLNFPFFSPYLIKGHLYSTF